MDRTPYYHPSLTTLPVDPNSEGALSSGAINSAPHVLDPGYGPQTIHRSDLFFVNSTPHMNTRKKTEFSQLPINTSPPSISTQLYPYHQQSFHRYAPPPQSAYPNTHTPTPPYDHRQRSATVPERLPPPPIPPKPVVYPAIGPTAVRDEAPAYPAHSLPTPPPPFAPVPEQEPAPSPIDDSNELAMALALSQSESVQRKILEDKEEQDLARALMESMLSTGSNLQAVNNPFFASSSISPPSAKPEPEISTTKPLSTPTPPSVQLPSSSRLTQYPDISTSTSSNVETVGSSEFGRFEKWRIPEQPPQDGIRPEHRRKGSISTKPDFSMLPPSLEPEPQKTPPARPLSISSASSLPYTMPSPRSNVFGSTEPISYSQKDGSDSSARPATDSPNYPHQDGSDSSHRPATPPNGPPAQQSGLSTSNTASDTVLVFDDEAYARQLAAEEEEMARQEQHSYNEKRRAMEIRDEPVEQAAPAYALHNKPPHWQSSEVPMSHNEPYQASSQPTKNAPGAFQPTPYYPNALPNQQELNVRPITSISEPSSSVSYSPVVYPSLGTRRESESDTHSVMSHHSSTRSSASVPAGQTERPEDRRRPSLSGLSPQLDNRTSPNIQQQPPLAGLLNPNQFLDRELLLGVSIGFKPPAISTRLVPMQDPMPNIISIPYSRCPPLHLQAPDWRHLLRLMARLSGTRIEPTVEAMAVSKTDLKLRTVIQFIKPHPSSNEWRTILWFTVDHPVPPNTPGASRYSSGNPNLLPWSYTLSPVPMLLRDATDTQISKTYTVPATETVPLPNLPITFPNLALYLQAVLDDSRRHHNDPISLGKLGKMVQVCYPSVEQDHSEFDIPGRSTVGDLFKRVIGRNNKDKKKGKTTNNEETYQLVTPFVPDEWG